VSGLGYCTDQCAYEKDPAGDYCSICISKSISGYLMHCEDGLENCDEVGIDAGGVCDTTCGPPNTCNTELRYYCDSTNTKRFESEYCSNCEHCGDDFVSCNEECDPSVAVCDIDNLKYCMEDCTFDEGYLPGDLFCQNCAFGADGDEDSRYCLCLEKNWVGTASSGQCCGDDVDESWIDSENPSNLCLGGVLEECKSSSSRGVSVVLEGSEYYCIVESGSWRWSTSSCSLNDLHCFYDLEKCPDDPDCQYKWEEVCESDPQCKGDLVCKSDSDVVSKACCYQDQCWDGESCVPAGAYDSWKCENGEWIVCSEGNVCTTEGFTCVLDEVYKWVDTPSTYNSQCYGCEDICEVGSRCDLTDTCLIPIGESCAGAFDYCCGGYCTNDHCCPESLIWCDSSQSCESRIDISQTHNCSDCPSLCPGGYVCTSSICQPIEPCQTSDDCPFNLACVRDVNDANPTCCPSGQCWDNSKSECVGSGTYDENNEYLCKNGGWVTYCAREGVNYLGSCDSVCGSDDECHEKIAGSDFENYACSSTCKRTTETMMIDVELRKCDSTSLAECLTNDPSVEELKIDQGMTVPLTFDVNFPDELPRESDITISVDGKKVNQLTESTGNYLLENLKPGAHTIMITADHLDFLMNSTTREIYVEPNLENAISFVLDPPQINLEIGEDIDLELSVINSGSNDYQFTVGSNLETVMTSSLLVEGKQIEKLPIKLKSPTQLGSIPFMITFMSEDGEVSYETDVNVYPEAHYEVVVVPKIDGSIYSAEITNAGTVDEQSLVLGPGEKEEFDLGQLTSNCQVCAESVNVKKCAIIEPVSISINIPSEIPAILGEPASLTFRTTASKAGRIKVKSTSELFPEFQCDASCSQELSVIPNKVGESQITFIVVWEDYGIETRSSTKLVVTQILDPSRDQETLEKVFQEVASRITKLENQGIEVDTIKEIYDGAKVVEADTPEGVAQVMGELSKAKKYLSYAEKSGVPEERGIPIVQLGIGAVAVIGGLGALWFVFSHSKLQATHEVHHEHHAKAPSAKLHVAPDARTYNVPPGGKLVKLPNGQMMVVPAGMKVVRTDQGQYKLAHQ
jgi:hypothetical protein